MNHNGNLTRIVILNFVLALALSGFVGCTADREEVPVEEPIPSERTERDPQVTSDDVVVWRNLTQLDDLVHRLDHIIDEGSEETVREFVPGFVESVRTVAFDELPLNTRNPDRVRLLQNDLRDLAALLAEHEELDIVPLTQALLGVSPLSHEIMAAAGVPHVHGHHGHDHDHHHDHDHD